MRKISLLLALILLLGICGCTSGSNENLSETVIIETEEIVVDQNGNVITQSQDTSVSSVQSESSGEETDTAGDTGAYKQEIVIDYNTMVEVDLCDDIVRGYLDATETDNQYFWLNEYQGQRYDYQNVTLEWQRDFSSEYTLFFSENSD